MLRLVTIVTPNGRLIPGAINLNQVTYGVCDPDDQFGTDDGALRPMVTLFFASDAGRSSELLVLGTLDDFALPIPSYSQGK